MRLGGRLRRDRRGNVTILLAGAMLMAVGSAALAVDTGSIYLEKRRLQGIADLAALSAASHSGSEDSAARSTLAANNAADASIAHLDAGRYTADAAVAPDQRFTAGAAAPNAVRLTVARDVPLFFGRMLLGAPTVRIEAKATAARLDMAAFSIGSRLAAVGGGVPGALLSGIAGTDLNLSVMDYQALVGADIDLLSFVSALRTRASLEGFTFGDTLKANVTLPQAIAAMADVAPTPASAATLRALALRVPGTTIKLSQIIDLGPLGDETRADPSRPIAVDNYAMLREMLSLANGHRQVALSLGALVPGIVSTDVRLAIGERPANSPWLAVADDNSVTVRTAQARLYVDTKVPGTATLGLVAIRIPLYVELAQAEAKLASISCASGNASVALDAVPAVGQAAIADLDPAALDNFNVAVPLRRATLLHTLLLDASALATVSIGGVTTQRVTFSAADIVAHRVKTVSTGDLTQGIAASLVRNTDLRISLLGLGLNLSLVTTALGTVLSVAAPALDAVVDQLGDLLGVHIGQADLWVNGVRCGKPVLVG